MAFEACQERSQQEWKVTYQLPGSAKKEFGLIGVNKYVVITAPPCYVAQVVFEFLNGRIYILQGKRQEDFRVVDV